MRAVYLEGGAAAKTALLSGAVVALALTILLGWSLLRFSLKLPIRQLFGISSWIMLVLAVILVGKGMHSFQESGWLTSTEVSFFVSPFFGVFPTLETLSSQALTILICAVIWVASSKTSKKQTAI
jgi:high-affinity iron transporter